MIKVEHKLNGNVRMTPHQFPKIQIAHLFEVNGGDLQIFLVMLTSTFHIMLYQCKSSLEKQMKHRL